MSNIVFTTYAAALTGTVTFGSALSFLSPVAAKTSNYVVQTNESQIVFSNTGASSQITFTLPAASAGLAYTFVVENANGVIILASGTNTIRNGSVISTAGGTMTSNTSGSTMSVVALNNAEWITTSSNGSWIAA